MQNLLFPFNNLSATQPNQTKFWYVVRNYLRQVKFNFTNFIFCRYRVTSLFEVRNCNLWFSFSNFNVSQPNQTKMYLYVGSGGIHVPWTHSSFIFSIIYFLNFTTLHLGRIYHISRFIGPRLHVIIKKIPNISTRGGYFLNKYLSRLFANFCNFWK